MSVPPTSFDAGRWERLPAWLRPLDRERRGTGQRRLVESTLLVLILILLTVAVIRDVSRQVQVNHRLIADLHTWRTLTGHDYHNLSLEQNVEGRGTREVVCGNTTPGPPGKRFQICLIVTGPVGHDLREVRGGYYLPPDRQDLHRNRYACFGTAAPSGLCGASTPPRAPRTPLLRSG
jgi:hypothetical protein